MDRKIIFRIIAGAAALSVLSVIGGLSINSLSRHPMPVFSSLKQTIRNVPLTAAYQLYKQKVLFVDARTEEDYGDGHILNAVHLDFYRFNEYFEEFYARYDPAVKMVVYCHGISGLHHEDTCETSRFLAVRLKESGYNNVMVFEEGITFWQGAKYPVSRADNMKKADSEKMPVVNYFRDLVMLVIGIAIFLLKKNKNLIVVCQLLLGAIFIISGSTKLFHPEELLIIIDAYRILPQALVPFVSIVMPWLEFICGIALLLGIAPASGALLISGMNLFFIPALSYRAYITAVQYGTSFFEVGFDCGCGLGENYAWVLSLRDAGFLLIGVTVMLSSHQWKMDKDRLKKIFHVS